VKNIGLHDFPLSDKYYSEVWQIGLILFNLVAPKLQLPFDSNGEYLNNIFQIIETPDINLLNNSLDNLNTYSQN